jgi:hypothetical protein
MGKKLAESSFYPLVERWLKRHFACFKTAVNKGLRHGRIDITGVRDVGGDLSGAIETIGVEVKRGSFPFANACGQTLGYNVYVNRAYLADVREKGFTRDEIHIASHLGIGLIQIRQLACTEVLSSPFYAPIEQLNLRLLETMRLGRCQLCASVFDIGDAKSQHNRFGKLSRENMRRAINDDKGYMFWNREVAERKNRLKVRLSKDGTYERRFICPDCVYSVFSEFALYDDIPVEQSSKLTRKS